MLRVYLSGPPQADRADPWLRLAADGRPSARGRDVPARWPDDAPIEAVLAADQVRLIALELPPMSRERVRAAARYALEDQLATPLDAAAIAVASGRGGTVLAAVTSAALVREIATQGRRFARVVPESALAPVTNGWTWCASESGSGFVRRADGSAFAVGGIHAPDDALPAELLAALAQASRNSAAPPAVNVAFRCDAAALARWSQASGVAFVAAAAWRWSEAPPEAFAAAPDFLADDARAETPSRNAALRLAFRPALVLAAAALVAHLGALAGQWAWLHVEDWRLARALVDEAALAQLPDATTAEASAAAIARRNADLRHRAARSAPTDALPLLARAAATLGALPPGALRSAQYADRAWTLELGKVDARALSSLTRALGAAGLDAVAAPTPAGMRMRLSLAATAR